MMRTENGPGGHVQHRRGRQPPLQEWLGGSPAAVLHCGALLSSTLYCRAIDPYASLKCALCFARVRHGESWRLLTNFFVLPGAPREQLIGLLCALYDLKTFGSELETQFAHRTADYIWFLLLTGLVEVGLAALLAPPPAFLAEAAVAAVVHLWSQRCVTRRIMLYGLVDIEARYLSVASVGLKFLLSDAWPVEQILGITAAQLYHLASEDSKAAQLLRAPWPLRKLIDGDTAALRGGRRLGGR